MLKEGNSKLFFFALLGLVFLGSLIIIVPLIGSLVGGVMLAYIFHPVYERVRNRVRYKGLAAFLIAIAILIIITVPTMFLVQHLAQESQFLYLRTKQLVFSGTLIEDRCYEDTFICRNINNVNSLLRDEKTRSYLISLLNNFIAAVTKQVSDVLVSLPGIMVQLLVTLFTTYYLLTDGPALTARLAKIIPLKVHHQDQVVKQFGDVAHALIYGSLIVALFQGALAAFGFWLFGVKGFLWWGVITTFFALVPFVGTAMIWVPISTFLIISGYASGEQGLIWSGIGLFIYGVLVISSVDNILKPFIIAGRARVHPLLVMLGVIGGLLLFGVIGAVIGPFLLALLQTLFEIYERERLPHLNDPELCIMGHNNQKTHKR
ncbi:AI-2E family transporter [Candidatus Woesearchaeota archaeon]|nr:AI-2E family transporter [Candidatus Woesearchaeota archaeon]